MLEYMMNIRSLKTNQFISIRTKYYNDLIICHYNNNNSNNIIMTFIMNSFYASHEELCDGRYEYYMEYRGDT